MKKAHLGECSVTVWPKALKEICKKKTSTSWNNLGKSHILKHCGLGVTGLF